MLDELCSNDQGRTAGLDTRVINRCLPRVSALSTVLFAMSTREMVRGSPEPATGSRTLAERGARIDWLFFVPSLCVVDNP